MDLRYTLGFVMTALLARTAAGTSPPANQPQRAVINRIEALSSKYPVEVLKVLEAIAEGRAGALSVEVTGPFGSDASELASSWFKVPEVRAYAIRKIGLIGSDEAMGFLKSLAHDDISGGGSDVVYGAAQVEYRRALLRREPSYSAEVSFLEPLVNSRSDPWVSYQISAWAVEEICNRGSVASMPLIQDAIKGRNPSDPVPDIRFCVERMQIVNSDPDLVRALEPALGRLTGIPADTRIVNWALTLFAGTTHASGGVGPGSFRERHAPFTWRVA
jgi:hypothetical protein